MMDITTFSLDEESIVDYDSLKTALSSAWSTDIDLPSIDDARYNTNPAGKVFNCGKNDDGKPFCLAFVFTPNGLKRYCGSLENIRIALKEYPLCHGVVHRYLNTRQKGRLWSLFGSKSLYGHTTKDRYSFRLRRIRSGSSIPYYLAHLLKEPKQTKYYLIVYDRQERNYDIAATWKRMPSCYIKEFEDIINLYQNLE